jgi:hypothetical protein
MSNLLDNMTFGERNEALDCQVVEKGALHNANYVTHPHKTPSIPTKYQIRYNQLISSFNSSITQRVPYSLKRAYNFAAAKRGLLIRSLYLESIADRKNSVVHLSLFRKEAQND